MSGTIPATITSLVNNLESFKTEALLPLFEAVINSIQAIEESGSLKNRNIIVRILREKQLELEVLPKGEIPKIIGFEIEDDGIGFNEECYEAFNNYGTEYKLERGGKGIGRFTWLKAFESVKVHSIYSKKNNEYWLREFNFYISDGVQEIKHVVSNAVKLKTIVQLIGFKEEYQNQPSAYKKTSTIAQRILEHVMSYFILDEAPNIIVTDTFLDDDVYLSNLFDEIRNHITEETITVNKINFVVNHIKFFESHKKVHNFVFCGHGRDVMTESMTKSLGPDSLFNEENEKFIYSAYISGEYLDKHVNPTRLTFRIPEQSSNLYPDEFPVSFSELRRECEKCSHKFLEENLNAIKKQKKVKLADFIKKAPWFKGVLHYCDEVYDEIEINSSEDKIQEVFYKYKGKAELEIIKQHKKLLKTQPKSFKDMEEEFNNTKDKIDVLGKDTLAEYILYRKMIIELLDKKIKLNKEGTYSNENIVHDIFFPRYASSDQIRFEDHNLWLLDERLAFHSYAKSEHSLKNAEENQDRADIIVFSQNDSKSGIADAISIIEFKKPQRKNFDENPTQQVFRYVRLVNSDKIILPDGRDLRSDDRTRFYCYVVCDNNEKIKIFAEDNNYSKLKGELGYYGYNKNLNAHTEIIDFDKIVIDAGERHQAFFKKLGLV